MLTAPVPYAVVPQDCVTSGHAPLGVGPPGVLRFTTEGASGVLRVYVDAQSILDRKDQVLVG